jgi:hypothetical protein
MGLIDDIANHLESSLSLFTTFKIDVLSKEDNALTLRRYQSGSSLWFFDDTRDDTLGIQVLSRNLNQSTAVNTLETIVNFLVNLKANGLPNDGSYEFISCNVYINPVIVEKTDRNAYLYSALLQIIINRN